MHVITYVKKSSKETEFSRKNSASLDRFTHFFDMNHGGHGIRSPDKIGIQSNMPTTLLA